MIELEIRYPLFLPEGERGPTPNSELTEGITQCDALCFNKLFRFHCKQDTNTNIGQAFS